MLRQDAKDYNEHFGIHSPVEDSDFWNVRAFPHTTFPVVIEIKAQRVVKEMNYSLIPNWSQVKKPKFATYNARIESLCQKPTWKTPIKTHRCLVGISSFFESCYEGSHAGNIVEFKCPSKSIWTVAGIWSEWIDRNSGEIIESFAIITTKPSDFIKDIGHDRSPLFLPEQAFSDWLTPTSLTCIEAVDILRCVHSPLSDAHITVERPLKEGWENRK